MSEESSADQERERCLAILDAHQELIDSHLYIRLRNCMNNPDHDPRHRPEELIGYKPPPKKKKRKK